MGICEYKEFLTSPLHEAAKTGRLKIVSLLLDSSGKSPADINGVDHSGATPLMQAITMGQEAVAEQLIDREAKVELENQLGRTALHLAAEHGMVDVVIALLKEGADKDARDMFGETPLCEAVKRRCTTTGNPETINAKKVIQALLAAGADPTIGNELGYTPLHRVAAQNLFEELEILLEARVENQGIGNIDLQLKADPSSPDSSTPTTPLWLAAKNKHTAAVKVLMKHNADPSLHCQDPKLPTVLWVAFWAENLEMAKALLQEGKPTDPDYPQGEDSHTILHMTWLKRPNMEDWASLLVESRADLDRYDGRGYAPIHYATLENQKTIISILRKGGANLDIPDKTIQWTSLMMAASAGNSTLVNHLLNMGANWEAVDREGRDAFYRACAAGSIMSAVHILDKGEASQISKPDNKGITPLHVASKKGNLEMVKFLIEYGADTTAKSTKPFDKCSVKGTAAEVAREMGHGDVARYIETYKNDSQEGGFPKWDIKLADRSAEDVTVPQKSPTQSLTNIITSGLRLHRSGKQKKPP
ncbi:ankyrin repeat-containing domain protein [Podospora didyma]|uniref:Ankyrin repeat-containing domain protein n=1 Tax=Podospora didyma TaxID=330526 RepID=A0AAE0NG62_9PEZI|nr:ankyrin repeat-containing domain protein [Podospora didyma]